MYVITLLLLFCAFSYVQSEPIDSDRTEIKKEKIILEGDVFIIPNMPSRAHEFCEGCASFGSWNARLKDNDTKMPVAKDDHCIQIWMTSKDAEDTLSQNKQLEQAKQGVSCNWSCHGHPAVGSYVHINNLPYELLKDKKEGDVVEFDYHHPETGELFGMRLTCRQLAYRYAGCGDFQTCLEKLHKNSIDWEVQYNKKSQADNAKDGDLAPEHQE